MLTPEWPVDESRIDIIGSNGGDGAHHELLRLHDVALHQERELAVTYDQIREYINKNNLNPRPTKL